MNPSPLKILKYFIQFRLSRVLHAHRPSKKVIRTWKKNLSSSPYYKAIISAKNDFPILNKNLFMENFDSINTKGIRKIDALNVASRAEKTRDFSETIGDISVGLSSGTSGNKGIFLTTVQEREKWVGAVLDRVIGFSLRKRKVAFFLRANSPLYEAVKSKLLQFHFFDIQQPIHKHVDSLRSLKANILVAQPSVLIEIAKSMENEGQEISFDKIMSVAEVLEDDQKVYMEKIFGRRIDQVYQCTEGFLAHTCKEGKLHFNEDWLLIEKNYLDEKRFHPIITDYLRTTQPVVRYELNDIIHEGMPCSCGMKSTVIEKIEGRSDDVYRFGNSKDEVLVYPDFVRRAIIGSSADITNFVIVRKDVNTFDLSLELEVGSDLNKSFEAVELALNQLFSDKISPIFSRVEYTHDPMNKFRRVRNEYKEKI